MNDILVFGSHPDDIEFGCGAILLKMAAQKRKIVLVDLTKGEKSTNGTPSERGIEAQNAAKMINAERLCLGFPDCGIYDTYEGRLELVKLIRQYRPRLILAPLWKGEQNHPDHLATGQMARYACRYARFQKILPEYPAFSPEGILHYLYPSQDNPDFIIDVSDYVEQWKQMMACHRSQMQTFDYMDWNLRLASKQGVMIGKAYAQGLVKGNPIEIEDPLIVAKSAREI